MDVSRKNLIKESTCGSRGNRQHAKTKVDHVDLSATAEVPSPSNRSGKR